MTWTRSFMEQGRVDSFNKYLSRATAGKALPLGHKERIKISFLSLGGMSLKEGIFVSYGCCNKVP